MNKAWVCTLILVLALGGCAGLRQFPEKADGSDKDVLKKLDATYDETLTKLYKTTDTSAQKKIRNEFIERRLAVLDTQFQDFVRDLARDNANADLLVALAEVGVGSTGALVSETASQILSAVSGGLAGGKAAYDEAVLYDNAITALIAQMAAGRQQVAARILTRWNASVENYPLWLARQDIADYELAGSLPGAIISTAEDAKDKAEEAEGIVQLILPPITKASVTPEMFELRASLLTEIDGLTGENAKALLPKILASIKSAEPDLTLYTDAIRADDPDGSRARNLLREAVTAIRTSEDVAAWRAVIASI